MSLASFLLLDGTAPAIGGGLLGGGPTGLVWARQPGNVISGGLLNPQPRIEVQTSGVLEVGDTRTVTLSVLVMAGGPCTLTGTTSGPCVGGVFEPGNIGIIGSGLVELSAA